MSNHTQTTFSPFPAGFPLEPAVPPLPCSRPSLEVWLRHWLQSEVTPHRAQTTLYCYTNIVEKHLIPTLGKVQLAKLTPELVQRYYQWLLTGQGLSPNTVRKHHVLLHTSLQKQLLKWEV